MNRFIPFVMLLPLLNSYICFGLLIPNLSFDAVNDSIPVESGLVHKKMESGFVYYVNDIRGEQDKIEVRFIVKAGFQCEAPGEYEVSHVIEHAAFGSTLNFPSVSDFLSGQGLRLGIDYGAATGIEFTEYWIRIPSHNSKLLFSCLQLVRDWAENIVVDSLTVEREKMTVLNEIAVPKMATGNSTENDVFSDLKFVRDARDAETDVINLRTAVLATFYKRWYVSGLQALIVTGNVDVEEVSKQIDFLFKDLEPRRPELYTRSSRDKLVEADMPRFGVQYMSDPNRIVVQRMWRKNGFLLRTQDNYRSKLIIDLFNQMIIVRLRESICSGSGEFQASGNSIAFRRAYFPMVNQDALVATLVLPPVDSERRRSIEVLMTSLIAEQMAILKKPFSDFELSRAKADIFQHEALIDSARVTVERCKNHFLNNEVFYGFKDESVIKDSIVSKISVDDVNLTVARWLSTEPDILLQGCQRSMQNCPSRDDMARLMQRAEKRSVTGRDRVGSAKVYRIDSVSNNARLPANKPYEKYDSDITEARHIRLSNGAQIILRKFKPKGVRSSKIMLEAFKRGGASLYAEGEYYSALHAARIASASGLDGWSRNDLNGYFKCRDMSLYPFVFDKYVGFRGESYYEDFEELINILRLSFKPDITRSSFNTYIKQLSQQPHSTYTVYDSIVGINSLDKSFLVDWRFDFSKRLNFSDARRVFDELFTDMNDFVFLVTGDFDMQDTEYLLTGLLSDLGSNQKGNLFTREKEFNQSFVGSMPDQAYEILQNGQDKKIVSFYFFEEANSSLEDDLERKIFCDVFKTVLYKQLRWEQGNAYFISVDDDQLLNNRYRITIWIDTSYGDTDEMIRSIWAQLNAMSQDSPDLSLVLSSIERQINKLHDDVAQHSFWRAYFLSQYLKGRDLSEIGRWENVYRQITPEKIRSRAASLLEDIDLFKLHMQE